MFLELVVLGIGIIYGFLKPGKEDRKMLLKRGFLIGIVLAVILAVLGILTGGYMMLFWSGIVGTVIFAEVMVLVILFIVGTLIGDFFEDKIKNDKGKL